MTLTIALTRAPLSHSETSRQCDDIQAGTSRRRKRSAIRQTDRACVQGGGMPPNSSLPQPGPIVEFFAKDVARGYQHIEDGATFRLHAESSDLTPSSDAC